MTVWMLSLYCCGYAYDTLAFDSWEEADHFRETWVAIGSQNRHTDRVGVIS